VKPDNLEVVLGWFCIYSTTISFRVAVWSLLTIYLLEYVAAAVFLVFVGIILRFCRHPNEFIYALCSVVVPVPFFKVAWAIKIISHAL
jgi:hypothetical protein